MKETITNPSSTIIPKGTAYVEESIKRVQQMEELFDILLNAAAKDSSTIHKDATLKNMLNDLINYYESKQWLLDYELEEQGYFPASLKCGVLSEDGIYNFLTELNHFDDHASQF